MLIGATFWMACLAFIIDEAARAPIIEDADLL